MPTVEERDILEFKKDPALQALEAKVDPFRVRVGKLQHEQKRLAGLMATTQRDKEDAEAMLLAKRCGEQYVLKIRKAFENLEQQKKKVDAELRFASEDLEKLESEIEEARNNAKANAYYAIRDLSLQKAEALLKHLQAVRQLAAEIDSLRGRAKSQGLDYEDVAFSVCPDIEAGIEWLSKRVGGR